MELRARRMPFKLVLALSILVADGKQILESDNIALPQQNFEQFFLPATDFRTRETSGGFSRNFFPSREIQGNFIGNVLPLEPREAMPSITTLDVACHSDRMEVRMAFDRPFNGLIYSKGFYGNRDCVYVSPSSPNTQFTFQISAQSCGSQYIEPPGGTGYMENVIIVQNEPGIQEIWDTARGLRCVRNGRGGTGRSRQTVSAGLNVGMLEQQVVTFATDTQASASLDIQVGRGPFAPSASGLVKIGELMTMVVSVEGPPDIDVLVRQCAAHDGSTNNNVILTDENGCVIKKKILGSWQKQRGSHGGKGGDSSSMMTYSHFQAFKFPDQMDVFIECEVDLCNGGCSVCPEDESNFSGRKRRAIPPQPHLADAITDFATAIDRAEEELNKGYRRSPENVFTDKENKTFGSGLRVTKRLRVLSPDDISHHGDQFSPITLVTRGRIDDDSDVCVSLSSLIGAIVAMLLIVIIASAMTAVICIRVRTIPSTASSFPPESSFHAFSTVSGKNT